MGFYLRKSFKMGPLRLNLSKSGLGVSGGVKGARLGLNSRGQAYTHAGRYGVYYRKNIGSSGSSGSSTRRGARKGAIARSPGATIEIREDMGATYAATIVSTDGASLRDRVEPQSNPARLLFALVGVCVAVAFFALPGAGSTMTAERIAILGLALSSAAGLLGFALFSARARSAASWTGAELERVVTQQDAKPAEVGSEIAELLERASITPNQRKEICAAAYRAALTHVIRDGVVGDKELELLAVLESGFELGGKFVDEMRTSAFHETYLEAVSDHRLDEEEEASLVEIRTRLGVPAADVAEELKMIERLSELRKIREASTPPEIDAGIKLRRGEICYFKGEGRWLEDRTIKRFQEGGQKYVVRGLVIGKQGQLFITNKRLLLVHSGTSSIRHNKILDLEVDFDQSLLIITKDGVAKPTYITTPDTMKAGAILASAAGL